MKKRVGLHRKKETKKNFTHFEVFTNTLYKMKKN